MTQLYCQLGQADKMLQGKRRRTLPASDSAFEVSLHADVVFLGALYGSGCPVTIH